MKRQRRPGRKMARGRALGTEMRPNFTPPLLRCQGDAHHLDAVFQKGKGVLLVDDEGRDEGRDLPLEDLLEGGAVLLGKPLLR